MTHRQRSAMLLVADGLTDPERHAEYRCRRCHKWYRRLFFPPPKCCMPHRPTECCHWMEAAINRRGWVLP